jgi:hypothetical protein
MVGMKEQTWICSIRIVIFEKKNYDLGGSNKKNYYRPSNNNLTK